MTRPYRVSDLEPHYTLQEAAVTFFPGGRVTARSLRTEINKGRLRATRIAGKDLVSETAIREMLELCRAAKSPHASTSDAPGKVAGQPGSSATARQSAALAALQQTLKAPSERSKPTSPKATARQPVSVISIKS